ncbi:MAG TPA: phosphoribosylamine--glycine ligase [Methylomirabilota bacterium]|jgi:phosphoribosylamine--glycine ligase|nr:phosphoribosylamine--glycine ligase [Methylomirabilota bacterium]
MRILVLGSGGREHALVWKLLQSRSVSHVWCAPGNGGICAEAECVEADLRDIWALADLAARLEADLTVVGPEAPLVLGIADEFARRGLALLGPSKEAAKLEGSKVFAKEFMARHKIPTSRTYGVFDRADAAREALKMIASPVVLKADGLCAGKGVLVASERKEAGAFIARAMEQREFGESGSLLLMEEALRGTELSYIVLTDGEHITPLAPTQDHKRAFEGDQGPNTGGMGAYSADGMLSPSLEDQILSTIVRPAIAGLATEGRAYNGFLYCGVMLTSAGPKVLEFNCRLGDPETQPLMMRVGSDLAQALQAAAEGHLDEVQILWKPGASTCVVMASGGYPGTFDVGKRIDGLEQAAEFTGAKVFHAGTRRKDDTYYTCSGRVLGVTAVGPSLGSATDLAYQAAQHIKFEGAHYRKDIARHSRQTLAAGCDQSG